MGLDSRATVTAVVSGIGLIAAKQYAPGFTEILEALLALSTGTAIVQLRSALARIEALASPAD